MKTIMTLVLTIFLTTPIFGQENPREVDLRINGVGSGTSHAVVVRQLGKALRSKTVKLRATDSCSGSAETHLTLFYSGLELTLLGDGRGRKLAVYSIEVSSPKWVASGVPMGAEVTEVLTKFGQPINKEEQSGESIYHYVTKGSLGGVTFHFRDNKLSRVIMTEALC